MLIQYSYIETDEDGRAAKSVAVNVRSPETDDVIAGFIDFCSSIGIELKMDYTIPAGDKAH